MVLIVLLLGGLAALGLSIPAARGALDRHGSPFALLAVVIAAGLGWLVLYASGDDSYFAPDHVSRWEYVTRNGSPAVAVVVSVVLALASIVALAAAARSRRHARLRRLVLPAAALASFAIVVAAVALTVGH